MDENDKETKKFPQHFSKRHELNNRIVCMRASVQQARVQIINRIVHQIKKYKQRKGNSKDQEKAKRKASRLLEEIQILKKINRDVVSRHALLITEPLQEVLNSPSASAEQRVLARLSYHPAVKAHVDKYRDANPNWDKQIPVLLAMTKRKRKNPKSEQSDLQTTAKTVTEIPKSKFKNQSQSEDSDSEDIEQKDRDSNSGDDDDNDSITSGSDSVADSNSDHSGDDSETFDKPSLKTVKSKNSKPAKHTNASATELKITEDKPALPLPSLNKSVGSVKVKFLKDLNELEEDEPQDKNLVDITQAPPTRRPKSAFFVGGEDEPEPEEDYQHQPDRLRSQQKSFSHPNLRSNSKPVFKKGKLISKPQFQRPGFQSKRKGPPFNNDYADNRFGPNAEPLGNKRAKAEKVSQDFSGRQKPVKEAEPFQSSEKLHPSWEAKKKQQQISLTSFQGKKIVFDDDD